MRNPLKMTKFLADLLSWLNRKHLSHLDALKLAIKAWNSIDYTNLSKYETIVRYFCEKLPHFCNEKEDSLWATVREFVELQYPVGVVATESRVRLIDCLVGHLKENLKEFLVLKSALENSSFVSFFSANVSVYGKLMGKCLNLWRSFLEKNSEDHTLDGQEKQITEDLLHNLRDFAQYQTNNMIFWAVYLQEVHENAIDVVIYLQKCKINWRRNFFGILQGLFLSEDSEKFYRTYFEASQKGEKLEKIPEDRITFMGECLHVTLIEIEGFFIAFASQKDLCFALIEFLFKHQFVTEKMTLEDIVLGINTLISLIKSHNIRMTDSLSQEVREKLLGIFDEFAESNTEECLCLAFRTLQLNPILLEDDLSGIVVKYLFIPKNEVTQELFGQFFALSLETFHKLSRFEKILYKLLENIASKAAAIEFPRKLKRKLKAPSPQKRQKLTESGDFREIFDKCPRDEWSEMSFAWSDSFAQRFSRIILTLVPNASLQIWKGLVYLLQAALDGTKERQFDENSLFSLEFTVNVFCAYFRGCRLLERPDNVVAKIEDLRILTRDIIRKFLDISEDPRSLKSFLEFLSVLLEFEGILLIYRPEFIEKTSEKSFQKIEYINQEEWINIQGKCYDNKLQKLVNSINLKLLKLNSINMCAPESLPVNLERIIQNADEFQSLMCHKKDGLWIIKCLKREQKVSLAALLAKNLHLLEERGILEMMEDEKLLDLLVLKIFAEISDKIKSKKSVFCRIPFNKLLSGEESFEDLPENILQLTKTVISVDTLTPNDLEELLKHLKLLPVGFLAKEAKNRILFFLCILLHSLAEFNNLQNIILNIMIPLTQLGNEVDVFKYIPMRKMREMFPDTLKNERLYEILFTGASGNQAANIEGFRDLQKILEETPDKNLCMIALESLTKLSSKEMSKIRLLLTESALQFFRKNEVELDQLTPFVITLTAHFSKKDKPNQDPELGNVALKFINHFKKSQDPKLIELIRIVVDNRDSLQIPQDNLSPIVLDLFHLNPHEMSSIVTKYCTNEEFSEVLESFRPKIGNPIYVCKTFQSLGSSMSEEKGDKFATFYDDIIPAITEELVLKETVGDSLELVLNILKCHTVIVKNKKIPLNNEIFQNILTFLIEINLKRLKLNIGDLSALHKQMTELCYAINQHRSTCLRSTMPHFVSIFKDLVHGICSYRSERTKKEKLEQHEVDALVELALKL